MTFNRIRIGEDAAFKLKLLKGWTGLTPNLLSRLALCHSLEESKPPPLPVEDKVGQEFNRYTLFGEWDSLFVALVKERCLEDGLDPEGDLLSQLQSHLHRGIATLYSRVRGIGDIYHLLPTVQERLEVR